MNQANQIEGFYIFYLWQDAININCDLYFIPRFLSQLYLINLKCYGYFMKLDM